MPFSSLLQADVECLKQVRLVATDMDGTLTTDGKFTAELIQTLEKLALAEIPVVIVTGRSAGWVSGLVHYLPVLGAIAENGGIFFPGSAGVSWSLVTIPNFTEHRQQLAQMFQSLQETFPNLQESADNRYRLTDWTFDVQGLTLTELEEIRDRCQQQGWGFTYSTVQVHIKLPQQDKAAGLLRVISHSFPHIAPDHVLTVGDSPNDETLFNPEQFPLSVGVANVLEYRDRLTYQPAYVTQNAEGAGFCELSQLLLSVWAH